MSSMCDNYIEKIGDTEIYDEYKNNKKSRKAFIQYLCFGSGVLGKCTRVKDEL